jgi:hypothetical protein
MRRIGRAPVACAVDGANRNANLRLRKVVSTISRTVMKVACREKQSVFDRNAKRKQELKDEITRLQALAKDCELEIETLIDSFRSRNPIARWEYMRLREPDKEQLSALGLRGWELVSVVSYETKGTFESGITVHLQYVFKRQIVENPPELKTQLKSKYEESCKD